MLFRRFVFSAVSCLAVLFITNDLMAQRGWGGDTSRLQYLYMEQVQEELALLDDQVEDLKELGTEARQVWRDAFSGSRENFREMSGEERDAAMKEIRAKVREEMKGVEEKIGSILVAHQMERLDQIVLQGQMRRGAGAAFQNEALRERLGITEEEAQKLKEKEEEVRKELDEKIKKLRAEAQDKVLSVLSPAKQKTIKEMIGEKFELEQRGRGDRRAGDGDRGGRGRRGGRDGGGGENRRRGGR